MKLRRTFAGIVNIRKSLAEDRISTRALLRMLPSEARGAGYARNWKSIFVKGKVDVSAEAIHDNPLRKFFEDRKVGRGIWKWTHYFDAYHRHLQKFVGREVHIVEIGIYSGGSIEMWQSYFGPKCHVYGVDIEEVCKAYDDDATKVFIGDQEDRTFWRDFKRQVPRVDIIIDDGGHTPEQQRVTLEEMLPHLQPGGVFMCEDIHENPNDFASYVHGMATELNTAAYIDDSANNQLNCVSSSFQRDINSIHFYPFLAVIEKNTTPVDNLLCPKHGTEWQPIKTMPLS